MSFLEVLHFRFRCDEGVNSEKPCGLRSPTVEGIDIMEAAYNCERDHRWVIVMGQFKPLWTYCHVHAHIGRAHRTAYQHGS